MITAKPCVYIVDHQENLDVTCGEPALYIFGEQYLCHQHAHDQLDELEPCGWTSVAILDLEERE